MSIGENSSAVSNKAMGKRPGKRPGRKPSKIDERAKLERSRQSARECRARKKLRYQYLEELVLNREKAVFALRDELDTYKQWCFQLDHGGPVPEAILKMIAHEDVSGKRRQMAQVTRSLLQQQRQQQQQLQFSSSSSSTSSTSPELSPSSQMEHQNQLHRQVNVVPPQSMLTQSSQLPHSSPSHSSSQHHHQLQLQQLLRQKQAASTSLLQRQFALDHSQLQEQQPHQIPQLINDSVASVLQGQTQRIVPHHKTSNQLQQQVQRQHQHQQPTSILSSHQVYLSPQSEHFPEVTSAGALQEPFLTRVKSEPPLKYENSFNVFKTFSNVGINNSTPPVVISQGSGETVRGRSLSNPATMNSLPRPNLHVTSPRDMPSSLQDFITAHSGSDPVVEPSGLGFGLFTGSLMGAKTHTSSVSIPPITIEDSSSSDDNINEHQLFQSSLTSQKRTLSAPLLPDNPKRSVMSTSTATMNYDPQTRLLDLINVHCSDATKTSNTSSPSSYGLTPASVPSPTPSLRYSGVFTSTPSSSATASPAPLSSISSILELSASSPGMSSATFGTTLEMDTPSSSRQPGLSRNFLPEQFTTTSVASFIAEPIPEWYSFLTDLEDGAVSALASRHGVSSNHRTSVALTPKQHGQPLTTDPSFMNVPNIIDEILDSDDQLL